MVWMSWLHGPSTGSCRPADEGRHPNPAMTVILLPGAVAPLPSVAADCWYDDLHRTRAGALWNRRPSRIPGGAVPPFRGACRGGKGTWFHRLASATSGYVPPCHVPITDEPVDLGVSDLGVGIGGIGTSKAGGGDPLRLAPLALDFAPRANRGRRGGCGREGALATAGGTIVRCAWFEEALDSG